MLKWESSFILLSTNWRVSLVFIHPLGKLAKTAWAWNSWQNMLHSLTAPKYNHWFQLCPFSLSRLLPHNFLKRRDFSWPVDFIVIVFYKQYLSKFCFSWTRRTWRTRRSWRTLWTWRRHEFGNGLISIVMSHRCFSPQR